ncbi:MAG: ABC transporter ATP-binding protein [Lachnospiraceae bacterium]|nr:ABC transporter ATP-binding protein [Lachnospiraceae bacterium]
MNPIFPEIQRSITNFDFLTNYLIPAAGYFFFFRKTGAKPWKAFVPFVQGYTLGVTADREEDAKIYCILSGFIDLFAFYLAFVRLGYLRQRFGTFLSLMFFAVSIASFIYQIRFYLSLCKLFQRSRRWVLAWCFFHGITALIWGLNRNFIPHRQEADIDFKAAAKVSGASLEALKHGITINLKERTVNDYFKKKTLLKDIHLSIPTGRMVLLLGGSGAGKTTFLNAMTGYEKADASVILNGNDLYSNYSRMKYDLGFVPQQDLIRFNDTVYMTLSDAAQIRLPKDIEPSAKQRRIQEMLDRFGLDSVKQSLVGKLSGGQRKRLSIAMEYVSDPMLFILDEPDSGLDGVTARNLFEGLRSIADEGKIVIVITHTPDRVIDLFDDVIVLAKDTERTGRLAFYGSIHEAQEFFGRDTMEEIVLSVNQKDEGGEGRADEFVEKYGNLLKEKAG